MRHHHHRITPAAALTLALAAATAPPAWGQPNREPGARIQPAIANASAHPSAGSSLCSEVCSAGRYRSLNQRAPTPDESGATLPHNPRTRPVAAGNSSDSVNATTRTPATLAACGDVCSGHGYGSVSAPATFVRTLAPAGGFDWGDAGIGAGAAIILLLIGTGGVLATTTRRSRRSRRTHQQQARAHG